MEEATSTRLVKNTRSRKTFLSAKDRLYRHYELFQRLTSSGNHVKFARPCWRRNALTVCTTAIPKPLAMVRLAEIFIQVYVKMCPTDVPFNQAQWSHPSDRGCEARQPRRAYCAARRQTDTRTVSDPTLLLMVYEPWGDRLLDPILTKCFRLAMRTSTAFIARSAGPAAPLLSLARRLHRGLMANIYRGHYLKLLGGSERNFR